MAERSAIRGSSLKPRHGGPRLPNFIVIGAMKAGTTSLFHYLTGHPDVFMSPLKEVDFFAEEANWGRGVDWYRRQFSAAPENVRAIGEASTVYTKWPHYGGVPERMASVLPEARLIYVVRDPVERIRSHYEHRVAVGAETLAFDEAIASNPVYLDYSRYAMQLSKYAGLFAPDRILVVTSESLKRDRRETIRAIFTFLEVDADVVPANLETEFYRTGERANWSPAMWRLRRTLKRYVPAAKRAKELVDTRLRPLGRRPGSPGTGRNPKAPSPVTEEAARRIRIQLADDVLALAPSITGPFDGWGIVPTPGRPP